jgi:hypothetical protein
MPTGTFVDGVLSAWSQQVTFNSVAYIADNIDYEVGTKVVTRTNEFGVPQAEILIIELGTGSMVLQVPAGLTTPPVGDLTGTIKDVDGTTTIKIKVTKVGRKFVADGETKVPIDFRQRIV